MPALPKKTHVFHGMRDFLDFSGKAPAGCSSRMVDAEKKRFTETSSYEEAVSLATDGWDAVIAPAELVSLAVEDKVEIERFDIGFQAVYDVAGAECDVALYLSGEPECMVESVPLRISRQGRAVRLIVPIGFRSHVKAKHALARGSAILALVDLLAKAQHPVEIWAVSYCTYPKGSNTWAMAVKVQDASDPVDIGNLSFALAHPSMLRRLTFAARSHSDQLFYRSTMGGTVELTDALIEKLLPPAVGTDIRLPTLTADQSWSPEYSAQWVTQQLARIFD